MFFFVAWACAVTALRSRAAPAAGGSRAKSRRRRGPGARAPVLGHVYFYSRNEGGSSTRANVIKTDVR